MLEVLNAKKGIKEIRQMMAAIRRSGGKVDTNYFNQCNQHTEDMECWYTDKTVVFEYIEDNVYRIYFYTVDEEGLADVLAKTKSASVIDFVTKEKDALADVFEKAGYKIYIPYGRFYVKIRSAEAQEMYDTLHNDAELAKKVYDAPYGEMALESDAEEIDRQLRKKFDVYEAHFYSLEKLREHIRKGWVWVAKENGKIIAANLFEIQGRKAYGAYLYNCGDVDVLTSLIEKTNRYVAEFGTEYSYCWMRLDNKKIIRYNVKFNGYVEDGLYDMIYVKE